MVNGAAIGAVSGLVFTPRRIGNDTLRFDNSYTAMARDELHSLRIFEHQKTYHEKHPASNADPAADALQLCKAD